MRNNLYTLDAYTAVQFQNLTDDVSGDQQISLRAPESAHGEVLLNGVPALDQMIDLQLTLVNGLDRAITVARMDERSIQARQVTALGEDRLMLHRAVPRLELVEQEGAWSARVEHQNIKDSATLDYFLTIVAMHALKHKPGALTAHLTELFDKS